MNKIFFEEKQKFTQWWMWLVLLGITGDVVFQLVQVFRHNSKVQPAAILWSLLPLVLVLLLWLWRLEYKITEEGICVRTFPIALKFKLYKWEDMEKVYIRDYSPIGEYGGWGIRGLGGNRAFNIKGTTGLQIIFVNHRRLLIGTQQKAALRAALLQMKNIPFDFENSL